MPEPPPDGRAPGWREVLLIAAGVVGVVLGLELLSAALPGVRELFRGFPVVILALVVGTAGLLVAVALRRPRT